MDPITGTIDKLEEILGHSPHPAIVALPVGAWTVSNICDGLYLLTGNDAYDNTAQVSMAIGLLGAGGRGGDRVARLTVTSRRTGSPATTSPRPTAWGMQSPAR